MKLLRCWQYGSIVGRWDLFLNNIRDLKNEENDYVLETQVQQFLCKSCENEMRARLKVTVAVAVSMTTITYYLMKK